MLKMKTKRFMVGISLFITPEMYADLKRISDMQEVSLSELVRKYVQEGLQKDVTFQREGEEEWKI
jgi:hypothetical protein